MGGLVGSNVVAFGALTPAAAAAAAAAPAADAGVVAAGFKRTTGLGAVTVAVECLGLACS